MTTLKSALEADKIQQLDDLSISMPLIALTKKETDYLTDNEILLFMSWQFLLHIFLAVSPIKLS